MFLTYCTTRFSQLYFKSQKCLFWNYNLILLRHKLPEDNKKLQTWGWLVKIHCKSERDGLSQTADTLYASLCLSQHPQYPSGHQKTNSVWWSSADCVHIITTDSDDDRLYWSDLRLTCVCAGGVCVFGAAVAPPAGADGCCLCRASPFACDSLSLNIRTPT